MFAQTQILDEPQFTRADVLQITGLSTKALQNMLDRNLLTLAGEHNPGTGRRRLFSGSDILGIKASRVLNDIGFPLRWSYQVVEFVRGRAASRLLGTDFNQPNLTLLVWPMKNGDWANAPVWEGMPEEPVTPIAVQCLQVDRLIDETITQLKALVADEEVPNFDIPDPPQKPLAYEPGGEWDMWEKDDQGRNCRTGLSFDETKELVAFEEADWASRTTNKAGPGLTEKQERRFEELSGKHEEARHRRLGERLAERFK